MGRKGQLQASMVVSPGAVERYSWYVPPYNAATFSRPSEGASRKLASRHAFFLRAELMAGPSRILPAHRRNSNIIMLGFGRGRRNACGSFRPVLPII